MKVPRRCTFGHGSSRIVDKVCVITGGRCKQIELHVCSFALYNCIETQENFFNLTQQIAFYREFFNDYSHLSITYYIKLTQLVKFEANFTIK